MLLQKSLILLQEYKNKEKKDCYKEQKYFLLLVYMISAVKSLFPLLISLSYNSVGTIIREQLNSLSHHSFLEQKFSIFNKLSFILLLNISF